MLPPLGPNSATPRTGSTDLLLYCQKPNASVTHTNKTKNNNMPSNHLDNTWYIQLNIWPVKLLEQIHGDEADEGVLGGADAVVLKALGEAVVLGFVWTTSWHHHSSISSGPLNQRVLSVQTTLSGKWWRRRVPAPPPVCRYQLQTSVTNPVESLHEDEEITEPEETKWRSPRVCYKQPSSWTHKHMYKII